MRSNYKKLGPYIRVINEKNKDLEVDTLLGVSIQKCFMPSIANTVGTDMSKYKIVRKNQFAYGPVTSRNGDKISVALLQDQDAAIISQAYVVFESIDHNELDPEYLMMWFRRPEFDRYARFMSHGSARETFDWEEMCDVELPIPSIEKQRAIVAEYNTVVTRIQLNEQLNHKLEETAQLIYKKWFVDFEFPNEDGEPYKASGGKMVWNEKLDKEIPEGWEVCAIANQFDVSIGRTPPRNEYKWFVNPNFGIKWASIKDMGDSGTYLLATSENLTIEAVNNFRIPQIPENTVILSFKMSVGKVCITKDKMLSNEAIAHMIPNAKSYLIPEFIYCYLKEFNYNSLGTTSSIVTSINSKMVKEIPILVPCQQVLGLFENIVKKVFRHKLLVESEAKHLLEFKTILQARMTKVEETTEKEMT